MNEIDRVCRFEWEFPGVREEKLDDAGAKSCIRARLTDVRRGIMALERGDRLGISCLSDGPLRGPVPRPGESGVTADMGNHHELERVWTTPVSSQKTTQKSGELIIFHTTRPADLATRVLKMVLLSKFSCRSELLLCPGHS